MKKNLIVALVLCLVMSLFAAGCQAGLTESNITVYADGSGVKTVKVMIYGDASVIPGKEYTGDGDLVGNNSKYLLVSGDELVSKLKSYIALEGTEVTAEPVGEDTLVTFTYSFSSIADYFEKTKTLAKDNADKIEEPTFTDNGNGTFTYKENTENTKYSIDNIFFSLYNDPEAFSKDGQGDCDLEAFGYTYTCIYTILSESATLGDATTLVQVNVQDSTGNAVEQDWADYIEVTGTPASVATEPPTDPTQEPTQAPTQAPTDPADSADDTSSDGLVIGIAAAVLAVAVIVVIIVISKKKKA